MSYKNKINIRLEQLQDKDGIEELYGLSFSPGRYVKTVFRMREKYDHLINISHVALIGDNIMTSINTPGFQFLFDFFYLCFYINLVTKRNKILI